MALKSTSSLSDILEKVGRIHAVSGRIGELVYSCVMAGHGLEIASEDEQLYNEIVKRFGHEERFMPGETGRGEPRGIKPGDNALRMMYLFLGPQREMNYFFLPERKTGTDDENEEYCVGEE